MTKTRRHIHKSTKHKSHKKKTFATTVGFLLVVAIAGSVIIAIAYLSTQPLDLTSSTPAQQLNLAKERLAAAASYEVKGETGAALTQYQEALKYYQKAGDRAGEEGVKLQITYLESIKE